MKILFVCKGNMFRSPMAEAIAGKLIGEENVLSVGTYTGAPDEPEGTKISSLAYHHPLIEFMKTQGVDLSEKTTKRFLPSMCDDYDIIVDMAEDPYDPDILKNNPKVVHWKVENPLFQNYTYEGAIAKCREIYEILEKNIKSLVK